MQSSSPAVFDGVRANDRVDLIEQLQTENEELRVQVLELQGHKDPDERPVKGAEVLARIVDENPDPMLQVSTDGVVQHRNPASIRLCRQWNPRNALVVPPAVYEIVTAAYTGARVVQHEMTAGEHTYLLTVAPPGKYVNIHTRDITSRKKAEEELREVNATLEDKVAERTAELECRTGQLRKMTLTLAQTEERERKRMAEILHDDLQQIIAGAKFHLSLMEKPGQV